MTVSKHVIYTVAISALMSLLSACSQPSPLHEAMEEMAKGVKAAVREEAQDDKLAGIERAMANLKIAQQQKIKAEDQAEFDKGLLEAEEKLIALKAAVNTGESKLIRAAAKSLKESQDKYHEAIIDQKH